MWKWSLDNDQFSNFPQLCEHFSIFQLFVLYFPPNTLYGTCPALNGTKQQQLAGEQSEAFHSWSEPNIFLRSWWKPKIKWNEYSETGNNYRFTFIVGRKQLQRNQSCSVSAGFQIVCYQLNNTMSVLCLQFFSWPQRLIKKSIKLSLRGSISH